MSLWYRKAREGCVQPPAKRKLRASGPKKTYHSRGWGGGTQSRVNHSAAVAFEAELEHAERALPCS
eukprot:2682741-Pyramimonas_sp.AAC.1